MKYDILIKYTTGGEYKEKVLEISFENLDVAKENLQNIKTHYEKIYLGFRNRSLNFDDKQKMCENYSIYYWFYVEKYFVDENNCAYEPPRGIKEVIRSDSSEYNLYLKKDDGSLFRLQCFWCGYHETLYGAEIILPKDETLSFEI